jgi:hypothetical protein
VDRPQIFSGIAAPSGHTWSLAVSPSLRATIGEDASRHAADVIGRILSKASNGEMKSSELGKEYRQVLPKGPSLRTVLLLYHERFQLIDTDNVGTFMVKLKTRLPRATLTPSSTVVASTSPPIAQSIIVNAAQDITNGEPLQSKKEAKKPLSIGDPMNQRAAGIITGLLSQAPGAMLRSSALGTHYRNLLPKGPSLQSLLLTFPEQFQLMDTKNPGAFDVKLLTSSTTKTIAKSPSPLPPLQSIANDGSDTVVSSSSTIRPVVTTTLSLSSSLLGSGTDSPPRDSVPMPPYQEAIVHPCHANDDTKRLPTSISTPSCSASIAAEDEQNAMMTTSSSNNHTSPAIQLLTFSGMPSHLLPITHDPIREIFQYLPTHIHHSIIKASSGLRLLENDQAAAVQLIEVQFQLGQLPMLKLSNDEFIDMLDLPHDWYDVTHNGPFPHNGIVVIHNDM